MKSSQTDVPPGSINQILSLLLEHLQLDIVCESTPDYTTYALRSRSKR